MFIYHEVIAWNMRLTPSRFRSSSAESDDEQAGDPRELSGLTIVHAPGDDPSADDDNTGYSADTFLPEDDSELLTVLDGMSTPVTVDEVADTLVDPAQPSIETWAAVHERLHQDRLPALDASGAIEFDETQGLVERTQSLPREAGRFAATILTAISIVFLLVSIGLVSVSVLIA